MCGDYVYLIETSPIYVVTFYLVMDVRMPQKDFRVLAFSVKTVFSIIFSVLLAYLFTESEFWRPENDIRKIFQ